VLVTTIPIALFAAWLIARSSAQQEALIDRQNIEQARAIIVAVDQEIEDVMASLNVLALLDPIDAPDKAHFTEIAARVIPDHPNWESIRLVDLSLKVVADTAGTPALPLKHPEWAKRVIETGRPAVSHALQEAATGRWMVTVGVPVRRGGALKYILSARLYARAFTDILLQQHVPDGGVVTLLDQDPKILARTLNEDKNLGRQPTPDFVARSRTATEGSWRSVTLEGTRAYSAWSRSGLTGWTIGIGMPAEPVVGAVRRSFTALVAAGIGMCVAALVLALILGRDIVRGQVGAAGAARALARGEAPILYDSHIAETHDLGEGLREAAAILEQRMRERDQAQAEAARRCWSGRNRRGAPPSRSTAPRTSSSPPSRTSCARRSTRSSAGCRCSASVRWTRSGRRTRSTSSSATRARRRSSSRTCSTCRASSRATCASAWSRSIWPRSSTRRSNR